MSRSWHRQEYRLSVVFVFYNYRGKVRSVLYSSHTRKLISSGDDAMVGVWDVETQREETAEWGAGSTCEKCSIPFFWNVKEMWAKKTIGVRQVYLTCTTYHFSMLGTSVALPFVYYMCVRLNFHDLLHFQYPFPRSCIHCSFVLCTNFVLWVLLKGYIVKAVCECSCTLSLSLSLSCTHT